MVAASIVVDVLRADFTDRARRNADIVSLSGVRSRRPEFEGLVWIQSQVSDAQVQRHRLLASHRHLDGILAYLLEE